MKYGLLIVLSFILNSAFCQVQFAEFSFDKKVKKYGVINEGDTLRGIFTVKNTGKIPLILSKYTVECHCTEILLPKDNIQPNQSFDLIFTFDSNHKSFAQDRKILIYINSKKGYETLRFKVYVNPKEN